MSQTHLRLAAAAAALAAFSVTLLIVMLLPQPSQAADMLICRKIDREGDKKGRTIRLHGKRVSYSASDGNDKVYGTRHDDLIQGGNGDDVVYGRGGDDIVCGGTGNDRVYGGNGNDAVYGEEGNDRTDGGPGTDYVLGGAEDDRVSSWGDGLDFIDGDYGKDVVVGGAGDQIFGGTLNDTLSLRLTDADSTGARYVNGGYDDDRIYGSPFADHIQGNVGADRIFGLGGSDDLRGGGSDDVISGGPGADVIRGEDNSDKLHGDGDDDTLIGGEGNDAFWGDAGRDLCIWERKAEPRHSCEAARQVSYSVTTTGASLSAAGKGHHGGGPEDGFSGSARQITSDGYPFPETYSRIAGYRQVRTADGTKGLLDKDSERSRKPTVVALGTVYRARELKGVISSASNEEIQWAYTNTCSRDYSSPDVVRSMSNTAKAPIRFKIAMPKRYGPKCDVAIWGKIANSKTAKSLKARLLYR